jgi:predicted transcriptional regulator
MKSNQLQDQEELILGALSFFEPMSIEKLIIDFSFQELKKRPQLNLDSLESLLGKLVKRGIIKTIEKDGEKYYIKNFPRRKPKALFFKS